MLAATVLLVATGCSSAASGPGADPAAASAAVPADVAGCESFAADAAGAAGDAGVPAVALPCLVEGPDLTLDDLGSRPVLVNLWASWCAPCREEMPLLQQAYQRTGDQIGFLGVNTEDTRSAAVSLITDLDVTYAHVVDQDKKLLTELGAPGLPVTLAVAADGRVVDRQIGQLSAARLDEMLATLTSGAGSAAPTP